jgi:hypothetical protein
MFCRRYWLRVYLSYWLLAPFLAIFDLLLPSQCHKLAGVSLRGFESAAACAQLAILCKLLAHSRALLEKSCGILVYRYGISNALTPETIHIAALAFIYCLKSSKYILWEPIYLLP